MLAGSNFAKRLGVVSKQGRLLNQLYIFHI